MNRTKKHVLIIANDVLGRSMAGPGIRAWEVARVLSQWDEGQAFEVTLALPHYAPRVDLDTHLPFQAHLLVATSEKDLRTAAAEADVVFTQGFVLLLCPWLKTVARALAVDIYDPFVLERFEQYASLTTEQRDHEHVTGLRALNEQLLDGDYFVCASEKQRDYWLGMLTALDRINPVTHDADPTLRALVDVMPFGLPSRAPVHARQVLKGVVPGIGPDDRVVLWHGGIWNWLDPETLIEAMRLVVERVPNARLFFMGVRHPNPNFPAEALARARRAEELARTLGLWGRVVFFNDWVEYEERVNYLLEADVSAMTYGDHIETRFAFRTRMIDAIYAGLPVVCTRGDTLGDLVEQRGLGFACRAGDIAGVADALIRLLSEPDARAARAATFSALAADLTWERVTAPLAAFCADPRPAPDKPWLRAQAEKRAAQATPSVSAPAPVSAHAHVSAPAPAPVPTPLWELPGRAITLLVRRGLGGLVAEMRSYLHWQRGR